jgi:sorbitol-specific phosphotransferase system component IIBC
MNIKSKVLSVFLGVLLALVILGGLACIAAGLLTLGWNVVGVAMLSVATSVTFLTMLKGVGILLALLTSINLVTTAIKAYTQKMQMVVAMKAMKDMAEAMEKAADQGQPKEPPDILRHFRNKS